MIKISEIITNQIVEAAKKRDSEHVSSGGLSASMLGNPLQWQVLKYLNVEPVAHDNYTYCKFQRGRDVEDFIFNQLVESGLVASSQEKAEYNGVSGLIDIYVPKTNEIIEVKSTTNMAFKYIVKGGMAKKNHILQACLYALAKEADTFSVAYVASDDYRVCQFQYRTADYKDEIDQIIADFNMAIKKKMIPEFVAKEKWQTMEKYSMYPEWSNLNSSQLASKARRYERN